jgi:hypothetical protein
MKKKKTISNSNIKNLFACQIKLKKRERERERKKGVGGKLNNKENRYVLITKKKRRRKESIYKYADQFKKLCYFDPPTP